jgi:hypothetical protein
MKPFVFIASFLGALFVWWLMGFDFDRRGIEVGCGFIICFLMAIIGLLTYEIHFDK